MSTEITISVRCADCDRTARVRWPVEEYAATIRREVTLDGKLKLPEGWYSVPGAEGGDNLLRCPTHFRRPA